MKHFFLRPTLIALLACSALSAQTGALIKYKLSSSMGTTGSIVIYYSDGNTRTETAMVIPQMPNGGFNRVGIIQKSKPTTVITLDDKAKTYSERDFKEKAEATDTGVTVKILGNEKIGTYNCVHSQVTQNGHVSEFWTTKDIPEYEKYASAHKGSRYMGRGNTSEAMKKAGAEGFLVKTFSKDARSGETSLELESFQKQDVPADKFVVPADYTKTEPKASPYPGSK
jgi:hypothetical protein